jgi:EmrB/QacA subfamily drug resistance transporter
MRDVSGDPLSPGTAEPAVAAEAAPVDGRRWYALVLLCAAFFVVVLGSTVVFTAAPSMAEALGFAKRDVQWVFTAAALTSGGLLLFGGRLADLLGGRRLFMTGVALFSVSSTLCGLAWSVPVLIGARTIQGAAVAIMTPAALSLVTATYPAGPDRNKALAVWSMIGGTGATAGLLTGGLITDALGWRWIFMINLPVGVVVLALSPMMLPDTRERRDRPARVRAFDPAGAATITAAVAVLVYAITQVPQTGWLSPPTIGLLAVAAMLVTVFAVVESRSPVPLLPLRILRNRPLVAGNLLMLVAGLAVDGMLFTLTLYTQQVLAYTAVQFGLALVVMTVASIGGSYAAQHVATKAGPRPVAGAGLGLIAAGCLLLTQVSANGTFLADLFPGLVAFGLGMGATFVAGSIASFTGIADGDSGVAAGLQNTSFTLGTAIGVAVMATVATARTASLPAAHDQPAALTAGYQTAFAAAAAAALLCLVAVPLLSGRNPTTLEDNR